MEVPLSRSRGLYLFSPSGRLVRIQDVSDLPAGLGMTALNFAAPAMALASPFLPRVKDATRFVLH